MATFEGDSLRLREGLAFGSQEEIHRFLAQLVGRETITNATYFGFDIPVGGIRRDYLFTTYPETWASHYFAHQYQDIDPVIRHGMSGLLPFDWQNAPRNSAAIQRFFGEATEFGIGERGLSVPIRGASGDRALFSITSSLSRGEWRLFKREAVGSLILLAYQFHLAVLQHEKADTLLHRPLLSPREIEVLKWAAEGKTVWATSVILGLSEKTVRFYLANAAVKLNATNKTQAVAAALRLSLL